MAGKKKSYSKKPLIAVLIFFISVIGIAGLLFYFNKNQCDRLQCLSMIGLDEFKLRETYENSLSTYRALLANNSDLLRVEVRSDLNPDEAANLITGQTVRMKTLFADAVAPYPGEITNEISCDSKFKPVYTEEKIYGIDISSFTGYLNDRLTFGACTDEQAAYRSILSLFYCPNQKKMYQVEIISPKDIFEKNEKKYREMAHSFRCL